ncbi:hypothetical protein CVT25_006857 [Psilocybe cyanescens]|uniref:Uncharacterized protein n=1 Tax=Psilocybe cyanescens TaxID=93625 RepID=A0A409XTR8_PSICY|nr:hypothetical protein CVT25_006857 [Psilocybe cyanescens]
MPLPGHLIPMVPAGSIGLQAQQALKANNAQPIQDNHPFFAVHNIPHPTKRLRAGTTKMHPSKTSTTPRNLCALKWIISNPKGTTDEFGTYYNSLSAEGKEKWEKLSVKAKEPEKTATE